jgi:hypothetical protein
MSDLASLKEAQRRIASEDGWNGNAVQLDCHHEIFADPFWNEYALALAIDKHKAKAHGGL